MSNDKQIQKRLELPHRETLVGINTIQTNPFDNQKTTTMSNNKQTAVDSMIEFCHKQMDNDSEIHKGVYLSIIKFCQEEITKSVDKELDKAFSDGALATVKVIREKLQKLEENLKNNE